MTLARARGPPRLRSVADPQQRLPGQINANHSGRGVYFDAPADHHLEAVTARYDGSALT